MDLTDVLREASIVDHSWQTEGLIQPGKLTFDPKEEGIKKRNNTKPELEVEWGNAGPQVDLNEPAGKVVRNIPKEDLAGAKDVIIFARDQMNRGRMGKALTAALKAKFDTKSLKSAAGQLRELFALQGIIGCIAVDGRGYRNCQDAVKAASHSPYKGLIKYIMGCECGDPHCIPTGQGTAIGPIAGSSGNAVDDFFASEAPRKTAMVSHCRSTMMPILSWRGDLDQSMVDQTLIDLGNMTGLPESVRSSQKSEKISSNIERVRDAFRMVNARNERVASEKYSGKVDNSEHIVRAYDNEIEFGSLPMGDLDVDPTDYAIQQECEPIAPPPSTMFDGPPTLFSELSDLELTDIPERPDVAVELAEDGLLADVDEEIPVTDDLDVDIQRTIPTDISPLGAVNVDMNGLHDEIIRINRAPVLNPDVDVDIQRTIPTNISPLAPFDVDMCPEEEGINFDNIPIQQDIEVDPQVGGMDADFDLFNSLGDVDMSQFKETEFEGGDEIELNDRTKPRGQLDVQITQDIEL